MGKFYNPLKGDSSDDIRPMSIRQILGSRDDLMGPLGRREEGEPEPEEDNDQDDYGEEED